MAERRLRAGVVGLGLMGRFHCRALNDLGGVDFVGAFDPDPHSPSEMHSASVVRTLDELLALGVDYCVVAAPTAHHLELGLALAEAGVHALIEKPLALDVDESRRLTDAFIASKNSLISEFQELFVSYFIISSCLILPDLSPDSLYFMANSSSP